MVSFKEILVSNGLAPSADVIMEEVVSLDDVRDMEAEDIAVVVAWLSGNMRKREIRGARGEGTGG